MTNDIKNPILNLDSFETEAALITLLESKKAELSRLTLEAMGKTDDRYVVVSEKRVAEEIKFIELKLSEFNNENK